MQINIDKKSVIESDKNGGNRITATGKYKGKIIYATPMVSKEKGTKGIEMGFRSDDGSEVSYLRLWLQSASGETYFGMGILQGIMACMRVKSINQSVGSYLQYDSDKKETVQKTGECFPELQNKPVGLLLQRVNYKKDDGSDAHKMEIICGFDHQTEQTGAEIMENKPAESLAKRIATLADKWEKPKRGVTEHEYYNQGNQQQGGYSNDDIPWN